MTTILEEIVRRKGRYVVLVSCLDIKLLKELIDNITSDIELTYLCFSHLGLEYDINIINNRIKEINNKGLIIYGLIFPDEIQHDYHINLAINKTKFNEIKEINKYDDDIYDTYINKLKDIHVRYINVKDKSITELGDIVFESIVSDIQKQLKNKDIS